MGWAAFGLGGEALGNRSDGDGFRVGPSCH